MTKKDFFGAVIQVVMIFIGVTTAIWFENINEESKTKKFEKIVLKEMIANLENDIKWMDKELRTVNRGVHAGERIIAQLSEGTPDKDSIGIYVVHMAWYSNSSYNTSSYETLKSKGLDIISNDTLRQSITQYYEVYQKNDADQMEISYNNLWNNYLPELLTNFEEFSMMNGTAPINMDQLKKDPKFKQIILLTTGFKNLDRNQFNRMKRSAKNLIRGIEEEIK